MEEIDEEIRIKIIILKWLINGYFTNCILGSGITRMPTKEWLIANYNIEESYFSKTNTNN